MDTTTLDSNTITLMVAIAASWLTLVGLIIFQTSRLDTKFDALGRDVDARERLARMEGHLSGAQERRLGSFARTPPPKTATTITAKPADPPSHSGGQVSERVKAGAWCIRRVDIECSVALT